MTGPTLTITVSGSGRHLAEFAGFSLRNVHTFRQGACGPGCLGGPYVRINGSRVPPLNSPVVIAPGPSAAVYVYARSSAGVAHGVHAPLVWAPGEQVVVPLTVATPEKRAALARLERLLLDHEFHFAKTMPQNPHFYTLRREWRDEDFTWAVETIRRLGHRERYGKGWYTVLDVGNYFYWTMGWPINCATCAALPHPVFNCRQCTLLINRKPLDAPAVEPVDQTLVVEDARRLDIPALRDGFAGLPPAWTSDPFFRFGVSMFGYQAALDPRPRLRKHGLAATFPRMDHAKE